VVSKVRGFLEALELPADDMLTSSSGCYRPALPGDATVDVELAAGEADAAERAFADGDPERAIAAAGTARALAGRPLLPGQEGGWVERLRTAWQQVLVRVLGARPWLVLTRQAYAGMLRGRGRREDLRRAAVFDDATRSGAATIGMDLPGWGRATLGPRT
jgi:hypothetical protein